MDGKRVVVEVDSGGLIFHGEGYVRGVDWRVFERFVDEGDKASAFVGDAVFAEDGEIWERGMLGGGLELGFLDDGDVDVLG